MKTLITFHDIQTGFELVFNSEFQHIPRVGETITLYDEEANQDPNLSVTGIVTMVYWTISELVQTVFIDFEPIEE
ncbi:MAG TPA: hypothetical protein VFC02_22585 [Anaerolineales bacterium]|nr:hypothetical protein [Anaerolineales bacterium]